MSKMDMKKINEIIKGTLAVIEDSKGAIFDIAENARREVVYLKEEIVTLQSDVAGIISQCDDLEKRLARSRHKLAIISKEYEKYSEKEMQAAYQEANQMLVDLEVARERERQTIIRRNDTERKLKWASETVGKAERLVARVGTVFDYLSNDLQKLDNHLEGAENKKNLAIQIIRTQEDERRRIAREMHDGPAQAMTNVVLKAEVCERLAEVDIQKAKLELTGLKSIVRACLKDVRRIIYDLRPMSIDDLGLRPTLSKYVESYGIESNFQIELKIIGDDGRIKDRNIIIAIFRVVQESLNNIRKHAQANSVFILMECSNSGINLRIKDDGKGFDIKCLERRGINDTDRLGIYGMKERVELLEGKFSIDSVPGKGTTVKVYLPYSIQEGISNE